MWAAKMCKAVELQGLDGNSHRWFAGSRWDETIANKSATNKNVSAQHIQVLDARTWKSDG
jgi:hypothetical protein